MQIRFGSIALACLATVCALAGAPAPAMASHSQIAIMQDDQSLLSNPIGTLQEMRHLGVQMIRVTVPWSYIAPDATSHRRPNFSATNPNAYASGNWAPYDAIVEDATADHIKVLLSVTAAAPFWAQAAGAPPRKGGAYQIDEAWKPSASAYGQFFQAVAKRYSGHFTPPGSAAALPRVSDWELYNEANFGEDIGPQAIDGSRLPYAPIIYRSLLNAAWSALRLTGHASDTTLIGALAARGEEYAPPRRGAAAGFPGTYGETPPLDFIRELYCVNSRYQPYRGAAAAERHCPTTAAAARRFRAQNPALFSASGFSIHPYPLTEDGNEPPTKTRYHDSNFVSLSQLPNLASALDHVQRVYGSGKRFPLWNDEYGYITDPPTYAPPYTGCRCHFPSPATQAYYMNWAEYLMWKNSRVASYSQYQLYDPNPTQNTPEYGGFASGLLYYPTVLGGQPKPSYYAYRMPIFLPQTSARIGSALQVWGAARPAPFAVADGDGTQYVQIQFQQSASQPWIVEKTLRVTDPHGYFDTYVAFPSSGNVRTTWTYPLIDPTLASSTISPGQTSSGGYIEPVTNIPSSRTVKITLK